MSFSALMASAYPPPPRSSRRRRHPSAPTPIPEAEQRSPLLVPGQDHHHHQPATLEDPGRGIAHPATAESAFKQDVGEEEEEEDGEGEEPRREITTDDVLQALDEALTALDADARADAGKGVRDEPQESTNNGEEKEAEEAQRVRSKLRDMVMFRIVSRVTPSAFSSERERFRIFVCSAD